MANPQTPVSPMEWSKLAPPRTPPPLRPRPPPTNHRLSLPTAPTPPISVHASTPGSPQSQPSAAVSSQMAPVPAPKPIKRLSEQRQPSAPLTPQISSPSVDAQMAELTALDQQKAQLQQQVLQETATLHAVVAKKEAAQQVVSDLEATILRLKTQLNTLKGDEQKQHESMQTQSQHQANQANQEAAQQQLELVKLATSEAEVQKIRLQIEQLNISKRVTELLAEQTTLTAQIGELRAQKSEFEVAVMRVRIEMITMQKKKDDEVRAARQARQEQLRKEQAALVDIIRERRKFEIQRKMKELQDIQEMHALEAQRLQNIRDQVEIDRAKAEMRKLQEKADKMRREKEQQQRELDMIQKQLEEREKMNRLFFEMQAQIRDVELDIVPPDWSGNNGWPNWQAMEHVTLSLADPVKAQQQVAVAALTRTIRSTEFRFKNKPFARGGVRLAYHCIMKSGMRKFVLKKIMVENHEKSQDAALESIGKETVRCQLLAMQCTRAFMGRINGNPAASGYSCEYVSIEAVREMTSASASKWMYWTIEPMLDGSFLKFNDNAGGIHPDAVHASSPGMPQALSHFSYTYFNNKAILVDVQGTWSGGKYLFTDPAFHTVDQSFGQTDLGQTGIESFLKTHRCTPLCKALGL